MGEEGFSACRKPPSNAAPSLAELLGVRDGRVTGLSRLDSALSAVVATDRVLASGEAHAPEHQARYQPDDQHDSIECQMHLYSPPSSGSNPYLRASS